MVLYGLFSFFKLVKKCPVEKFHGSTVSGNTKVYIVHTGADSGIFFPGEGTAPVKKNPLYIFFPLSEIPRWRRSRVVTLSEVCDWPAKFTSLSVPEL
jgi:hypothetical protein